MKTIVYDIKEDLASTRAAIAALSSIDGSIAVATCVKTAAALFYSQTHARASTRRVYFSSLCSQRGVVSLKYRLPPALVIELVEMCCNLPKFRLPLFTINKKTHI